MLKMNRYPGSMPFTLAHEGMFFGREKDIEKLIWLNTCQEKNLSIPKKLGPIIFIERLDRGGVCNNDGRAL
ncbi:hypothetical protein DSCOOX_35860 [Desulfosarcina ovata subsp. ovata]|uniref:Uncharacterized protein n=1 Tax=Desulfosarcina ovata subsp. ovata TaxID=2752305 RepID=A0A5K8AD03_9BACT|nr:hypothetical protein DSCOOX_35860 [Desulfosarcina ovata subsp. ovata]